MEEINESTFFEEYVLSPMKQMLGTLPGGGENQVEVTQSMSDTDLPPHNLPTNLSSGTTSPVDPSPSQDDPLRTEGRLLQNLLDYA